MTAIDYMNRKPKEPNHDIGPAEPVDPAFSLLRAAYNRILGIEVNEDGETVPTDNAFRHMHVDDREQCKGYIEALADAYNASKRPEVQT